MRKIAFYSLVFLILITICLVFIISKEFDYVKLPHGSKMYIYKASKNNDNHCSIIIFPGGAYKTLSKWYEGLAWFPFFHENGYTIAMLNYRMPHSDYSIPNIDASEAIKYMRYSADNYSYKKEKVGVMGFSAGGHLASTLTVSKEDSIRPDFTLLFYPVISMKKELTHLSSHNNLLGEDANEELEQQFSNELHVSNETPPVYIALSHDDKIVNSQNSHVFIKEMIAKKRKAVLHEYPSGGHGWGYRNSFLYHKQMTEDVKKWLEEL